MKVGGQIFYGMLHLSAKRHRPTVSRCRSTASTAELLRHSCRANCNSGWTPFSTSREGRDGAESCQCVVGRTEDHSWESEVDDDCAK